MICYAFRVIGYLGVATRVPVRVLFWSTGEEESFVYPVVFSFPARVQSALFVGSRTCSW